MRFRFLIIPVLLVACAPARTTITVTAPRVISPVPAWAAGSEAATETLAVQAWYRAVAAQSTPAPVVVLPSSPPRATPKAAPMPSSHSSASSSLQPCGGDLPPCWVKARESGGNYRAHNPSGCGGRGCYGAYQFDPRTWDAVVRRMGRPDLVGDYFASPSDQDAVARVLWNGGAGCANWDAC